MKYLKLFKEDIYDFQDKLYKKIERSEYIDFIERHIPEKFNEHEIRCIRDISERLNFGRLYMRINYPEVDRNGPNPSTEDIKNAYPARYEEFFKCYMRPDWAEDVRGHEPQVSMMISDHTTILTDHHNYFVFTKVSDSWYLIECKKGNYPQKSEFYICDEYEGFSEFKDDCSKIKSSANSRV